MTGDDRLVLQGPERCIELIEFKGAHSVSDLVMILPEEKIVFTGDLVFISVHPYLADGDTDFLRCALEDLQTRDIQTVVPGHGLVGDDDSIGQMIRYIEMVERLASTQIQSGKKITAEDVDAPFDTWSLPNFFKSTLKYMVDKISNSETGYE